MAEAAGHRLAALAGSSPDVGVIGYTLGGGLSWLGRRHGLAASNVVSAEIVTADGRIRQIDAGSDRDLFWAIRGGGGSFGAVTAIEFALFPVAEVYAGGMLWPIERAGEILHAWREWAADMPDDMTTVGRLLQLPSIPDIPEPLCGRSFVAVEAFHIGAEAEGAALVAPMRALGLAMSPEQGAAVTAHVDALREALSPWEADTAHLNFSERDVPGDRLFGPYAHHRLRAVKAAYDPTDLFRSNHPVAPAG